MPSLPQRKVGIVACSGEELPEGTVTRLAALKVLEELRPYDTVTICLPLFLAGGEGDRAFAKDVYKRQLQDLFDQIVHDVPVVSGEGPDEPVHILMALHGERG